MTAKKRPKDMDPVVVQIRNTRGLSVRVAEACGIERAAVYQWKKVPPHWVHEVSKLIKLPPKRIRPDIFK